jgi:hypothetical protein
VGIRRVAVVIVLFAAVLVARPRPARADLASAVYDDVRDVVQELIESEISTSVVATIETRAPVVAAYFHGTLDRLATASWGGLSTSLREDLTVTVADFVYWHLSQGSDDDDLVASAKAFFATAKVSPGRNLLDAECRRVDPPADRRVACDIGLAVRAALEGRDEARHHVLDAIGDILLGAIDDAALGRRLRDLLVAWIDDAALVPAVLAERLAVFDAAKLEGLCGDRARLRDYLERPDGAPGWACFAISAAQLPPTLAMKVTVDKTETTIHYWQLETILDGIDPNYWGDDAVFRALAGEHEIAAGTTITVQWLDKTFTGKLGAQGKIRATPPIELARWTKRFDRVRREVEQMRQGLPPALQGILFVRDAGREDAGAILRALSRMSRLSARLHARWYLWSSANRELKDLDIVALLELARDTVVDAGEEVGRDARVLGRIAGAHARALGDWLRLVVRGDYRALAMESLRAALDTDRPHEAFFVALAAYLLDSPEAGGEAVTRGAFRAAAKRLLDSVDHQGVPRTDDRLRWRWIPTVGIRVAFSDDYALGGADNRRTLVSADWPTFLVAATDHVGLAFSVLDPVAPLSEMALRPAGNYDDETLIALDAVRPRAALWLAAPELSRRLALSLGVGARLVGLEVMSAPDAPVEARYVRRTSVTIDAGLQLVF